MNPFSSILGIRFFPAMGLLLFTQSQANTVSNFIPAELFDPDFLEGDSNYHSLTAASNGLIYFTIGTHKAGSSARFFTFDPATDHLSEIGRMNEVLGENTETTVPHGKVHTPLIEDEGFLYFSTHTSTYRGGLPDIVPESGRDPYPGGHFMRYHLRTGTFESLAQIPMESEGLITMAMDTAGNRLFGLTWPSGILYTYSIDEDRLLQYGAVQGRGEWGQLGKDWDFICRRLAVGPDGRAFGSSNDGSIWEFDSRRSRPIEVIEGLSLDTIPDRNEADFVIAPTSHYFWRNWRTILWNPETASFWGLHGGSTQLFEFQPETRALRSVTNLRVDGLPETRRNPLRSQLGFMLGPENTLFYLAHGPAIEIAGRREISSNVYLVTYQIDTGITTNHGPVVGPDDRRVFYTESIAIGPDDHLYSVAWVETINPDRMTAIQTTRGNALPDETREIIYEIQLIRLPPVQAFIPSDLQ